MKTIFTFISLVAVFSLFAQSNLQQPTSINTDGAAAASSAMLDVSATDKGMLVPRLTSTQRTMIASPATGLLVFDTTTESFWFYTGTTWTNLSAPKMLADADGDTKIQAEESPNEDVIRFDMGGVERLVLKKNAADKTQISLPNNGNNILLGENAGDSITTGFSNVAIGKDALFSSTNRSNLVAVGDSALYNNGVGFPNPFNSRLNTAIGSKSLFSNTGGYANTGIGNQALFSNTTGILNTAAGNQALYSNTTGSDNTATGNNALWNNAGDWNTATGSATLFSTTSGNGNTAIGHLALYSNLTGSGNTAVGLSALNFFPFGDNNTGLGAFAGITSSGLSNATAVGARAVVGASNSLVLGSINGINGANASVNVGIGTPNPEIRLHIEGGTDASPTGGGYLQLGESGGTHLAFDNNEIIARNNGVVTQLNLNLDGGNVRLGNSNSHIGVGRSATTNNLEVEGTASKSSAGDWLANSDARLKKNITPLDSREMLQKLLALQGIRYEWNDDKTGSTRPEGVHFGFTAQNIRKVFPSLVEEDNLGYLQTAYGTYDAMLVEAIRALKQENDVLRAENATIKTQLATHTSQLDKINAALQSAGIIVEN